MHEPGSPAVRNNRMYKRMTFDASIRALLPDVMYRFLFAEFVYSQDRSREEKAKGASDVTLILHLSSVILL